MSKELIKIAATVVIFLFLLAVAKVVSFESAVLYGIAVAMVDGIEGRVYLKDIYKRGGR